MGLDMGIHRKVRENTNEALLNKLEGKKEVVEIAYWRKFWELQNAIGEIIDEDIENCKGCELNEDNIRSIISWLDENRDNKDINQWNRGDTNNDIELLNKVLKETDFKLYKLVYSGWW